MVTPSIENDSNSVRDKMFQLSKDKKLLEDESLSEQIGRETAQYGARAAEIVLGWPGNMKKAFGQIRDLFDETFALEGSKGLKGVSEKFGKPEEGSVEHYLYNPPTTEEIRKKGTKLLSEKIFGEKEFLEPKSEREKAFGETSQDLISFFMPGTRNLRTAVRMGAPIAGNLVKQGVKYLDLGEENAEKAKLGVMLMTTLAGQTNPGQFSSNRIQQAKQMIPDTATIDVTNLANRFMPLYRIVTRGLGVPSKSRAIQGMQELAGQVQNNRMSFRSLIDARDNVNEWISEAGGWDVPTNTRDATLRNLNELKRQIITTIEENMTARFPQAADLYRTGYEAAAVTHQSNAISNFIEKNFGRKTASIGVKLLFPSIAGGAAVLPKTAIGAAGLYPLYKTGQVLYRIANSQTLAHYYQEVITMSTIGNVPAMVKSMDKLDKALAEDERKNKFPKNKKTSLDEFKNNFKNKD